MKRINRLLFGPLAAAVFGFGIVGLGALVPGYSPVRQTVSEIGEVGSPEQIPFTLLLFTVAICTLIFALGVRAASIKAGRSSITAYLILCGAVSAAGVGLFSFPHPLHNIFGQSELIGYQAPLAAALTWRRDPHAKSLVTVSWMLFAALWVTMGLNLAPALAPPALWVVIKPAFGLIQRSLFATWFLWCALAGVIMWRWQVPAIAHPLVR